MKRDLKKTFSPIVLFSLLWDLNAVSSDVVKMMNDIHVSDVIPRRTASEKIPDPKITRDYQGCTEMSGQTCVVMCSVSNVPQAQLSWYNGSSSLFNLTVSDLNNKLYLLVENHDKNNYSCVVSSSGTSKTTHLNIPYSCYLCLDTTVTTLSVIEGDSVTLHTNLTKVQYEDYIMWLHGDSLIAVLFANIKTYYDCKDGRFRNRLQLDSTTGSLTINNMSEIHSGQYTLQIINITHQECQSYNVTVYERLPIPVITNNATKCSSSPKCVVMCSVNVTRVTLSWYNESRLHSSISVSDLKRNNFLCLEVEYQDINTYSCVVNNSFTNQTTRLNVNELCKAVSWKITFITIVICGGLIALVGGACWYWRNEIYQMVNGSEHQHEASDAPADNNGASGQDVPDNRPHEERNLLDQQSPLSYESL